MSPAKLVVLLIVIGVFGIVLFRSPDQSYWLKPNPDEAIKIGRVYAYHLLNSTKEELLKMPIDPAEAKLKTTDSRTISTTQMFSQLEKEDLLSLIHPLIMEQTNDNMELIVFEKLDSFVVMTFAYIDGEGIIVEIPQKGKLLFSVAVSYYEPSDDRLLPKLVRKIANLPLARNFMGRMGTTGHWAVVDYDYKYNIYDYFDWALTDGKTYKETQDRELEKVTKQLESAKDEQILESADRYSEFLYKWGSLTIKKQIEEVEQLYQTQAESFDMRSGKQSEPQGTEVP